MAADHPRRYRAALGVGVLLLLAGPAVAAMPAPTRTMRATAIELLTLTGHMIRSGRARQAEPILELLVRDPNPEVRNEARYRQSLLLEARGRNGAAAVLMRRILDEKPDAAAVRLKLATILQKMGDEGAALRELRAVRSSDLPENIARFVDRLSASLQASKPLGFQIELAVAPDSNINRATRSDTLGTIFGDFAINQKKRSGVGASLRTLAHARLPISGKSDLVTRVDAEVNLYRDKDFNDIVLELATGPELRLGRNRLGAELGISQQWYGMKPYQRSLRLSAAIARPVNSVSQLRVDVGARQTDNKFNDLQDGRGLSLRARYERALSPQMLAVASVGIDRFQARDDAYSTRSWNAGVAAYRDVARMTLSAGIEIGRLQADERLALLSDARNDKLTRFHVGAVYRRLTVAGFAPITRVVFERNKSSVDFYDYKRTRTEIGISRAF